MLAAGLAVSTASYSAFSATSSNDADNWSMGSVALNNDAANGALFSASNLKPGSTGTNCIAVTSSGSLASAVRLYATNVQQTKALASYVTLQVKQGSGGGTAPAPASPRPPEPTARCTTTRWLPS
ncbi:hypothetical protein P9139_19790 [Curtobacterium flaccumfaciens]|nr:hypothetical protein P9139_19790 [Curtobacterium flaccumfaciens]